MIIRIILTLLLTPVYCDECIRYTFGEDYVDTFDNVKNPCQESWYLWALKTYNESTIERPNEKSEYYIETVTYADLSCVSSFNMFLSAGGTVDVNVYMMRTSYLDQFSVIVNMIDMNTGIGTVAGQANFQPVQDWLPVWHTLSVPLEVSTGSGLGYISFLGAVSGNESILIVDSFRYVPANVPSSECELYSDDVSSGEPETPAPTGPEELEYTTSPPTTDLTTDSETTLDSETTINSETTLNGETTDPTLTTDATTADSTTSDSSTSDASTYDSTTYETTVNEYGSTDPSTELTSTETPLNTESTIYESTDQYDTTKYTTETNYATDLPVVNTEMTTVHVTEDPIITGDPDLYTTNPPSTSNELVTTDTNVSTPGFETIQTSRFWTPLTIVMVILLCCLLIIMVALISYYIGRQNSQGEVFVETYFDIGDLPKLIILPRVRKVLKNINTNPYMNNNNNIVIDNEF